MKYVNPESGHYKVLYKEINHHIVHDYYYSALVLLDSVIDNPHKAYELKGRRFVYPGSLINSKKF